MSNQDIIFDRLSGNGGEIGFVVLNRPRALNALTREMCTLLRQHLFTWQHDVSIKAVVIVGEGGRAFCAGGDIRALYELGLGKIDSGQTFFQEEYAMNAAIYHFRKPYISLLDGITMGGGAGVSMHGSHRIATDHFLFAMPETSIGFFPDIGAASFFKEMPNHVGYYLALTGARLKAGDAYKLGLVTHVINREKKQAFIKALCDCDFNETKLEDMIASFSKSVDESPLDLHMNQINDCFSAPTIEEIIYRLDQGISAWHHEVKETLLKKSPTSLKVTLAHLSRAMKMDFDAIIHMDFNVASQFLQQHDFFEGIRSVLIDKDNKPQWRPRAIKAISDQTVDDFFEEKYVLSLSQDDISSS